MMVRSVVPRRRNAKIKDFQPGQNLPSPILPTPISKNLMASNLSITTQRRNLRTSSNFTTIQMDTMLRGAMAAKRPIKEDTADNRRKMEATADKRPTTEGMGLHTVDSLHHPSLDRANMANTQLRQLKIKEQRPLTVKVPESTP